MSDYIRRETILQYISDAPRFYLNDMIRADTARQYVKNLPAADVEAVVRCKDCKYYDESIHFCELYKVKHYESFYCHDGTRSE